MLPADTGNAIAQEVSRRLLTTEARIQSQAVPMRFVVDKVTPEQIFIRVSRACTIGLYQAVVPMGSGDPTPSIN